MIPIITSITLIISFMMINPPSNLIKQTRDQIANLNISFYQKNYPQNCSINMLSESLGKLLNEKEIPKSLKFQGDYKKAINKLDDSYEEFKKFYQTKPEMDTLKKIFRTVNNNFNSLYGKFFLNELRRSSKPGIIIFAASLSCECTLDMCYKQETEVELLKKENPDLLEYAVIDAYEDSELKDKYKVGFIPAAILQDADGKEVRRFVLADNLYAEMKSLIVIKEHK